MRPIFSTSHGSYDISMLKRTTDIQHFASHALGAQTSLNLDVCRLRQLAALALPRRRGASALRARRQQGLPEVAETQREVLALRVLSIRKQNPKLKVPGLRHTGHGDDHHGAG